MFFNGFGYIKEGGSPGEAPNHPIDNHETHLHIGMTAVDFWNDARGAGHEGGTTPRVRLAGGRLHLLLQIAERLLAVGLDRGGRKESDDLVAVALGRATSLVPPPSGSTNVWVVRLLASPSCAG
jgi:hypothetical protein